MGTKGVKYTKLSLTHAFLSVWMVTEVMTFGTVLSFYRGSSRKVKQPIASFFGLSDTVFESWLRSLNAIRNYCVHHGRLWDQILGYKPLIPLSSDYPDWHRPVQIDNSRVFAANTVWTSLPRRAAGRSG